MLNKRSGLLPLVIALCGSMASGCTPSPSSTTDESLEALPSVTSDEDASDESSGDETGDEETADVTTDETEVPDTADESGEETAEVTGDEETNDDTADESGEETAEVTGDEETNDDTADESGEETVEVTGDEETNDDTADESGEETVEVTADESGEETAEVTADETGDEETGDETGDDETTDDDGEIGWTCYAYRYHTFDGCDCGCGIPDPDCSSSSVVDCDNEHCGPNSVPSPFDPSLCDECDTGTTKDGMVCRPVVDCDELSCDDENRVCEPAGDNADAVCGDCVDGFVDDEGNCRPVIECDELQCFSTQNRHCEEAGNNNDAACGDCVGGFEEVDGACVLPPLDNDTCGAATLVEFAEGETTLSITFDTAAALQAQITSCHVELVQNVFYRFKAPGTGQLKILDDGVETIYSIVEDCDEEPSCIVRNEESGFARILVKEDVDYTLQIARPSGDTTIELVLLEPPENDICEDAIEIVVPIDDDDVIIDGSVETASNNFETSAVACDGVSHAHADVFYKFIAPQSGTIIVELLDTPGLSVYAVRENCSDEVKCNASSMMELPVSTGQTYVIGVDRSAALSEGFSSDLHDDEGAEFSLSLRYIQSLDNTDCLHAHEVTNTVDDDWGNFVKFDMRAGSMDDDDDDSEDTCAGRRLYYRLPVPSSGSPVYFSGMLYSKRAIEIGVGATCYDAEKDLLPVTEASLPSLTDPPASWDYDWNNWFQFIVDPEHIGDELYIVLEAKTDDCRVGDFSTDVYTKGNVDSCNPNAIPIAQASNGWIRVKSEGHEQGTIDASELSCVLPSWMYSNSNPDSPSYEHGRDRFFGVNMIPGDTLRVSMQNAYSHGQYTAVDNPGLYLLDGCDADSCLVANQVSDYHFPDVTHTFTGDEKRTVNIVIDDFQWSGSSKMDGKFRFHLDYGWQCSSYLYGDGLCDCGCQAPDSDCETPYDDVCEYDMCPEGTSAHPAQNWLCQ